METYKTGTVNTIINENGVDLGSINVNLYTMDNKTSVIDIHIKKKTLLMKIKNTSPLILIRRSSNLYYMFLPKMVLYSLMSH